LIEDARALSEKLKPELRQPAFDPAEPMIDARTAAKIPGISLASWWIGVREERFPAPLYPMPRSARWRPSEIYLAIEKTRAMPHEVSETRAVARKEALDAYTAERRAKSKNYQKPEATAAAE
jgi:predicted DNA-binding transcriptional regulator AlpA